MLNGSGRPYVIENVPLAPIRKDLLLCGTMFGLMTIRHRHFEISGFRAEQPRHPNHSQFEPYQCVCGANSGTPPSKGRERLKRLGATWNKADWENAMDIDWMTRKQLAEAIPPAYAEYIGREFLRTRLGNESEMNLAKVWWKAMWKVTIVDEATGETLDTARIDPDRQPDHRKPVEIQVKRNGQIVGKGW
jgi:hypothetical protein